MGLGPVPTTPTRSQAHSSSSSSDSWSALLVLAASSSSSELASQAVWKSCMSSRKRWDTWGERGAVLPVPELQQVERPYLSRTGRL